MPETIIGTRTKLELISESHGSIRVPLAQSFDYTPGFTERKIFEFDNAEAALVVTQFDGVDIRFDYLDTDSKLVDAALNDLDPGLTVTEHDPSVLREVNIILNVRSEDGLIFQSVLAKGVRIKGVTATEPVREEGVITVDGGATNVLRYKGAALLYSRILANTPDASVYDQSIPPNSTSDQNFAVSTPFKITLDKTAVAINEAGDLGVLILKNGEEVDTGFTLTSTEFTVDDPGPDATDIWEVITAFIDS